MRQQMLSKVPSSDWQNEVELKESALVEKPPMPYLTLCVNSLCLAS